MLHQYITDYPASWPVRFGVPSDRIKSLLATGLFNHGLRRILGRLRPGLRSPLTRAMHDHFSKRLARVLPDDMDFFIGLSSFCREALFLCRERGIRSAVDHGSLHQAEEAALVRKEAARWGVDAPADECPDWIIAKEDEEFAAADHVFALSTAARDSLVRQGVAPDRIFVNPCGVDLSAFNPAGDTGTRICKTTDEFRVIQVGGISLRKGTLDLIDAFDRAQLGGASLWFVGAGLESSGLASVIQRMNTRNTSFLPPVSQFDLREHYHRSSVFVLASIADGFGMVVPQAMACGLPVIVTENVGARDLVQDGVNGFVVPIRSPEVIAERLRFLFANRDVAMRMGKAACETVRRGFGWADYGDRLAEFIKQRVERIPV
jgi:glycosyltransferase involved in cell wall biosynthesis